jgi:uncharacterized protein YceK
MKKIIALLAILAALTGCSSVAKCEHPDMRDSIGGCSARWS